MGFLEIVDVAIIGCQNPVPMFCAIPLNGCQQPLRLVLRLSDGLDKLYNDVQRGFLHVSVVALVPVVDADTLNKCC